MVRFDRQLRIRVTVFILVILCGGISCLKIVGVAVPPLADLRQPASLECSYDIGRESLFSVKWYKDDHEFYRYMPMHKPSVLTFPFDGAKLGMSVNGKVEPCGESQCSVKLEHLSPAASGAYTCEVSTEAPAFKTAIKTRNMTVAAFPLDEPKIEGLRAAYTIGDLLDITCKSAPSAPPAQLTMFVNNEEVEQNEMTKVEVPEDDDLSSTSARLRMVLSRGHFKSGGSNGAVLRVVCSAALAAVPAPAKSSAAMAVLADTQPLRNQKLEWPNLAAERRASSWSIVLLITVHVLNKMFL